MSAEAAAAHHVLPGVIFNAVSRRYGQRSVVREINLEIRRGEVFGLLGPNGSGKSTLIRMLMGLVVPSEGTVTVNGLDVSREGPTVRRDIGYVPEDVQLYPGMRAGEFLQFMGGLRGLQGPKLRRACTETADRLGLGPVLTTLMGRLSHGFRQRVLLAQALLGDPALIVLDEPGNGLDPQQIIELRHLIAELAGTHTVVVTSHVLGEVEQVAQRVAVLREGSLLGVLSLAGQSEVATLRVPAAMRTQALATLQAAGCGVLADEGLEARYLALIQASPGNSFETRHAP
jgi:ABC-2 type transport system ATP-binding protein